MENNTFKLKMPSMVNSYLTSVPNKPYLPMEWRVGPNSEQLFFLNYLFTKYSVPYCDIYDIFLQFDVNNKEKIDTERTDSIHKLVNCIHEHYGKKPIIIDLVLVFDLPNGQQTGHSNILIIRPNLNTIEHFEPFGNDLTNSASAPLIQTVRESISALVDDVNKLIHRYGNHVNPFTYINPHDVMDCPVRSGGFQGMEEKSKLTILAHGFCAAWCYFIMELVLCNPKLTTAQIIARVWNQADIISTQHDISPPDYFRRLITQYAMYLDSMLAKYLPPHMNSLKKLNTVPRNEWIDLATFNNNITPNYSSVSSASAPTITPRSYSNSHRTRSKSSVKSSAKSSAKSDSSAKSYYSHASIALKRRKRKSSSVTVKRKKN